ncbi:MAG: OST-HTH/LOTUS domain-containing protein [Chloroflexi bacterium]|nr:OST-HTH/LOTUS domain-containing protein [Chloroflexota bacterium]
MTTKAYGYQHLGMIGTHLKAQWRSFTPSDYGCKTLLELIERYPERFKVKWSARPHKRRSTSGYDLQLSQSGKTAMMIHPLHRQSRNPA